MYGKSKRKLVNLTAYPTGGITIERRTTPNDHKTQCFHCTSVVRYVLRAK